MLKSKINFESFLILHFVSFMTSLVFSFIIFDIVKDNLIKKDIIEILKGFGLLISLFFIWRFNINIYTKIVITDDEIIFHKFLKSKKINFNDLNFYFERFEYSKQKNYKGLFIVKGDKIIERISSFDYSNYEELKNKIKLQECKNARVNFIDILKVTCGFEVKIFTKNCS